MHWTTPDGKNSANILHIKLRLGPNGTSHIHRPGHQPGLKVAIVECAVYKHPTGLAVHP